MNPNQAIVSEQGVPNLIDKVDTFGPSIGLGFGVLLPAE